MTFVLTAVAMQAATLQQQQLQQAAAALATRQHMQNLQMQRLVQQNLMGGLQPAVMPMQPHGISLPTAQHQLVAQGKRA